MLFSSTLIVAQVAITSPNQGTVWKAGQSETITWQSSTYSGLTTFSLMNGTQGTTDPYTGVQSNSGATFVATIATNTNPSANQLTYIVPSNLQTGQYFIAQSSNGISVPDTPYFRIVDSNSTVPTSTKTSSPTSTQFGSASIQDLLSIFKTASFLIALQII